MCWPLEDVHRGPRGPVPVFPQAATVQCLLIQCPRRLQRQLTQVMTANSVWLCEVFFHAAEQSRVIILFICLSRLHFPVFSLSGCEIPFEQIANCHRPFHGAQAQRLGYLSTDPPNDKGTLFSATPTICKTRLEGLGLPAPILRAGTREVSRSFQEGFFRPLDLLGSKISLHTDTLSTAATLYSSARSLFTDPRLSSDPRSRSPSAAFSVWTCACPRPCLALTHHASRVY